MPEIGPGKEAAQFRVKKIAKPFVAGAAAIGILAGGLGEPKRAAAGEPLQKPGQTEILKSPVDGQPIDPSNPNALLNEQVKALGAMGKNFKNYTDQVTGSAIFHPEQKPQEPVKLAPEQQKNIDEMQAGNKDLEKKGHEFKAYVDKLLKENFPDDQKK